MQVKRLAEVRKIQKIHMEGKFIIILTQFLKNCIFLIFFFSHFSDQNIEDGRDKTEVL